MPRIISGFHAVEQFLRHPVPGMELTAERGLKSRRVMQLLALAQQQGIPTMRLPASQMKQYGSYKDHRGMVLLVPESGSPDEHYRSLQEFFSAVKDRQQCLMLLLDEITDPHNLGAVLRSADQFLCDAVVIPGRRSSQVTETVMKVSAGAAKHVPVITVSNLVQAVRDAQQHDFWVYAAETGGEAIHRADLTGRSVVVLGAEGKGISRMVREVCDKRITIPSRGHIDSLNVSVAAGILLYEIRRQQNWDV